MSKKPVSITILKDLPHMEKGSTHEIINNMVSVNGYRRGAWITKDKPTSYNWGLGTLWSLEKDFWIEINYEEVI